MTPNQQVLSDEQIEAIREDHISWMGDFYRCESPELAAYTRAIESAALAALAQQSQEPMYQFRRQLCADWYDGHPDHEDGGGPYETRILYTTPPAPQTKGHP